MSINGIKKVTLLQIPGVLSSTPPNTILGVNSVVSKISGLRVALCAIAKKENLYVREWVEYYKNLGISKIFLYDNNDLNGEHFEDVINDYITSGFVEIIDKRGIEKGLVYSKEGINLQTLCYIDCYYELKDNFDWICFFDIDEFFVIKLDNKDLTDFLNSYDSKIGTVVIPWEHYSDNGLFEYDLRNVYDKFTQKSKISLVAGKSIVRTGYELMDKTEKNVIHYFKLKGMQTVWVNGEDIYKSKTAKPEFNWFTMSKTYTDDAKAVLNHYKTKSVEEFLYRQYKRHWGTITTHTEHERTLEDCIKQYKAYNSVGQGALTVFNNYDPEVYAKKYEYYIKLKTFNKQAVYDRFNEFIKNIKPMNVIKVYNQEPYIISLTSWKGRINKVPFAIWNIADMCPLAHIVLVLASDEFTNKLKDLPEDLLKMYNNNMFEILWTGKNTKTLKKIFPTIKQYPNVPIISADDDCIYLCNYAKELYEYMMNNNSLVVRYNMFNKSETWQYTEGQCTIYNPKMYNVFLKNWWEFYKEKMYYGDDCVYTKLCKHNKIHIDHIYRGHTFCFIYDDESGAIHDWSLNYDYINCYID